MSDLNAYFKKGAEIEMSSNDPDFRGSWYTGTVISRSRTKKNNIVYIQYHTLMNEKDETKPLREEVDIVHLRPPAPLETSRGFSFGEEVDAFHNDGWWEGVITRVNDAVYTVYFRATKEELDFHKEELRLHREWVNLRVCGSLLWRLMTVMRCFFELVCVDAEFAGPTLKD
ncbi:protein AGENET DOMAIN (AGD)-CONTAINING P1-like [Apium graveolens]|uniref:protein AGENET DOMAIN (AGD)-CONTAINING P1-like n=1 Tax=Apium graveolens TaxID=4045 RepID=UPI003D7BB3FA